MLYGKKSPSWDFLYGRIRVTPQENKMQLTQYQKRLIQERRMRVRQYIVTVLIAIVVMCVILSMNGCSTYHAYKNQDDTKCQYTLEKGIGFTCPFH